ncbi:hypothetical protein BH20ACT18_BH20ACT18_07410 [soil metagenome]
MPPQPVEKDDHGDHLRAVAILREVVKCANVA